MSDTGVAAMEEYEYEGLASGTSLGVTMMAGALVEILCFVQLPVC